MILVDNYIGAILCCVYCCLCWGSWANTQKMVTSKSWSFELFYWDLTFGLFFTALLGALTLGSLGGEGRTFFGDLAVMDWNSSDSSHCCSRDVDRFSHWWRLSLDRRYNF